MKRKVIQHSPTSLVVTIPTSWARQRKIVKGDEIELTENGHELIIRKERVNKEPLKADIDISLLDKTSILYVIRNLYRSGYDKISIKFENEKIHHKNKDESFLVTDIIHQELRTLIGYEITREKKNFCVIENISEGISEEIPTIIKRIQLLLIDIAETLYDAADKHDVTVLRSVKQKRKTIVRFINYCLRSSSKKELEDTGITNSEYYLLATLDRIVHLLSSSAERFVQLEKRASKQLVEVVNLTLQGLRLFYNFRNTRKSSIIKEMNNVRYKVENIILAKPKTLAKEQDLVFFHLRHIHHLLLDISDVRGINV